MKKIIFRTLCCAGMLAAIAGCGNKAKKAAEAAAAAEQARKDSIAQVEKAIKNKQAKVQETIATLPEEPVFDIVTNMGTIKVKLYAKTPLHRANFEKLALSGYYDGLLFHRVIDGFMIQGGDPNTRDTSLVASYGKGGPDYTIPAEFVPEYTHKKGALAAARRGDAANPLKESSGSQFYLVENEGACAQLNGSYTVFGETLEGQSVIDKIAKVKTNEKDLPLTPVKIIKIKLDEAATPRMPVDSTAVTE